MSSKALVDVISSQIWRARGFQVSSYGNVRPQVTRRDTNLVLGFGNVLVIVPEGLVRHEITFHPKVLAGLQERVLLPPDEESAGFSSWCQARLGALEHPSSITVLFKDTLNRPWVMQALGERQFYLLVRADDYKVMRRRVRRGVAALAAGNFATEMALSAMVRHEDDNRRTAVAGPAAFLSLAGSGYVEPDLLADESVAPYFSRDFSGVRCERPLDVVVGMRLLGAYHLLSTFDAACRTPLEGWVASARGSSLFTSIVEQRLSALWAAMDVYNAYVLACARGFWDLGASAIVEPDCLNDASGRLEIIKRWFSQFSKELLNDYRVVINRSLWQMVFSQVLTNAEAAAETCFGLAGAEKKLTIAGVIEKDFLHLKIGNAVVVGRMRDALLPLESGLLKWELDPIDHARKQRLFFPGVTSRPSEEIDENRGGVGLALAWEFMQKMGGRIFAEYDPAGNWFTMHLLLPLEKPA